MRSFFLAATQRLLAEATTSSTSNAGGRLIRVRKKAKWFDRRSTRVPHNGKDVYSFGDQPSCELCHVRFRYQQDYELHKESELHQNRLRWRETQQWWETVGKASHEKVEDEKWEWFRLHVLPAKAKEMKCSLEEAEARLRGARMVETPQWHRAITCHAVKHEVQEPRDQRWPASPKW